MGPRDTPQESPTPIPNPQSAIVCPHSQTGAGSHNDVVEQRNTFSKVQRLHLQRDFARVFGKKCSASDARLVVYVDHHPLGPGEATRLGIRVGKRLGNAPARNRIKRLIREAFRLGQHDLPAGLDIICVARMRDDITLKKVQSSLGRLVAAAHRRLRIDDYGLRIGD